MKMKELEAGRKRKRSEEDSGAEVQKDVCICVRLIYAVEIGRRPEPDSVKWLKIKIPAILLDKLRNSSSSCVYDVNTTTCTGGNLFVKDKSYKVEGPFDFKCHVTGDDEYPCTARCAPIGSVIYAFGGNQSHIQVHVDYLCEALGRIPDDCSLPLPRSTIADSRLITGGKPTCTFRVSPRTYGMDELSNSFDFCDFSDPAPQWKLGSQPLLCPRYRPKLVSMFGKLFAFGGNRRESPPFAEVFDPAVGYWQPLPDPPFKWVSDLELSVFPLFRVKRILLVATYSEFQYTFDPLTWYWHRFDSCPDLTPLLHSSLTYDDEIRVAAVYNETIYWVDYAGTLSMYNLSNQRYQKVYVTGLCNPEFGNNNGRLCSERVMVLHPLSEDLLGIFWCKFNPLGYVSPLRYSDTNLDLVFFRLSPLDASTLSSYYLDDEETIDYFDEKTTTMTASLVDFLSFPVHHNIAHIVDAHPLVQDEMNNY